MKRRSTLLVALATTIAMTGYAPASDAAAPVHTAPTAVVAASAALRPTAAVHPSHGLVGFDIVTVSGSGLPTTTPISVIECDVPTSEGSEGPIGCPPVRTVTTTARGTLSTQFNVQDPVYREQELGDPVPVYCRSDQCRYYLEWTDATGLHSITTPKMYFSGSPATIAAAPATGLLDERSVHVTGSAHGSTGRYVTIDEVSCFQIIQGSGCDGAIPLATVKLAASGTYAGTVHVYRYLGNGEDCADAFYGCQLRVTVLDSSGEPDNSFGVAAAGDQSVPITFAS